MAASFIYPPPQKKQEEFLKAKAPFVAYGGARGGGKSFAIRLKLILMCWVHAGIRCLLLRCTFSELNRNHIHEIEKLLAPFLNTKGSYKVTHKRDEHIFIFPNGSILEYGHCEYEASVQKYQGIEYDIIAIDEATQFTESIFNALKACIRGSNNFPKRMYLTCNPGGVGHEWVKRLFIDRDFRENEKPNDYVFISAKVEDNAYNGEHYVDFLNSLQEPLRSAWLHGSWDTFVGQMFPEWDNEKLSVPAPDKLPDSWLYYMSIDYGLDCFAPIWYGISEDGKTYIIQGNEYQNCTVTQAVNEINITERKLGLTGTRVTRYAPPDLFARSGQTGKSIIDAFAAGGIYFVRSDNSREAGWVAIKEMLENDMIRVYENRANELCRNMRLIQYSETNPRDAEQHPHNVTHSPDSLRYFCIMRKRIPVPELKSVSYNLSAPSKKRHRSPFNIKLGEKKRWT